MANIAKKAILRAKLEGVLTDLLVKTNADNVYVGESTTLTSKLAEIVADIATRAKSTDVTTEIGTAINNLRTELMGEGVPEAYDTFKELADYIESHQEAADALTAAVGNKADKTAVEALQKTVDALGDLAKKSKVAETDLDDDLKAKVNASAEANHTHANKTVLDGITADVVASWNGKSKVHYSATEPETLADGDLWFQLID